MHPFINIAVNAARRAGKIIAQASQRLDRLKIAEKTSPYDLVTNIDKAAEEDIIETIRRAYPNHCILGEESGAINNDDTEIVWIIDPIDGTKNFIHGFPNYCVSIAVQRKGIVEQGVIYDPFKDELFLASKGEGAQLNGQRLRVSNCTNLMMALLSVDFNYKALGAHPEDHLNNAYKFLSKESTIRQMGSSALDLAYVAAGRLDGFIARGQKIWDIAAGSILIREAGGFISDFVGGNTYLSSGEIVTGNTKIYPELLKLLISSK